MQDQNKCNIIIRSIVTVLMNKSTVPRLCQKFWMGKRRKYQVRKKLGRVLARFGPRYSTVPYRISYRTVVKTPEI